MRLKGVNYDAGLYTSKDRPSRPDFPPEIVEREMEIIARDLHCNAIRITARDVDRLALASELALRQGLEVWLSPNLTDASEAELLPYLTQCARAAEKLRQQWPQVVFVVGTELTLFMRGIIDNRPSVERLANLMKPVGMVKFTLLQGWYARRLNRILAKAVAAVKAEFHGPVAYASGSWERVDWTPFDFVGIDHYRDAGNAETYQETLHDALSFGKPLVVTEFGCCTYQGAEERGGIGWNIVDWSAAPPKLTDEFVRDESIQADTLEQALEIFRAEDIEGAFVFTFVSPQYVTRDDPEHDLDMASYSLVKSYADHNGVTYPDMPWEPKEAFGVVASTYAERLLP